MARSAKTAEAPATEKQGFGEKMKAARAAKAAEREAAKVAAQANEADEADEAETDEDEDEESVEDNGAESNDEAITVYDDLLDLARVGDEHFKLQGVKESDQDYLRRLMAQIAKIIVPKGEPDPFDSMTEEAQDWYNSSVQAIQDDKPWEPPAGFVSKFGKKVEGAAKRGNAGRPAQPKKEKVAKASGGRDGSLTKIVRMAVYENINDDTAAIKARLIKAGHNINDGTIGVQRAAVLNFVREASTFGLWAGEKLAK